MTRGGRRPGRGVMPALLVAMAVLPLLPVSLDAQFPARPRPTPQRPAPQRPVPQQPPATAREAPPRDTLRQPVVRDSAARDTSLVEWHPASA